MALTPKSIKMRNAIIEAECPICQCRMIAPTAIPACGHKFCFTCLKGVCMNDMGCPMCRGPIDVNIFNLPSQVLDLKMDLPLSPAINQSNKKSVISNVTGGNSVSLDLDASLHDSTVKEEKHYWVYSGKNQGWWRFDPRHELDIEAAFNSQQPLCELIICGRPYIIDFVQEIQYPKNNKAQARSVQRVTAQDFDQMGVKGLAGVFVPTA